jgi:KDO2-lipid IV(A) lauroyltransferase
MGGKLYALAWRHAGKIPEPVLAGLVNLGADITWGLRGPGVRQLEKNFQRIRPDLTPRELRKLSRLGMRSYLRYFREAFTLQNATSAQLEARVRLIGRVNLDAALAGNGAVVLGLGHLGNWDLAGAWATTRIAPVLAVAEKLQPESLFENFVAYRNSIGISIQALGEPGLFDSLVTAAKNGNRLLTLLADRDVSRRSLQVDLCSEPALVAPGPAAVALASEVPLLSTFIRYERLRGRRRRAAGTGWGIVIHLGAPISVRSELAAASVEQRVAAMTQVWADELTAFLEQYPEDWHMMQPVFVADLDPVRLARSHKKQG